MEAIEKNNMTMNELKFFLLYISLSLSLSLSLTHTHTHTHIYTHSHNIYSTYTVELTYNKPCAKDKKRKTSNVCIT